MKPVKIEFTGKNLTGHAGLVQIGRFIDKLGLKASLKKHLDVKRGTNAEYSLADVVIILTLRAVAGIKHISQLMILRTDRVLRKIFERGNFPDDSTFGRILRLFMPSRCQALAEVENELRQKVWSQKHSGTITLDMDSFVRGVYGSQEGAAKGYNPEKPGQKSYHPLLCFIAETRECLHNWYRTGATYSSNGATEFMKECFARPPEGVWKILVRADSAFFDGELLNYLDLKHAFYPIKVKLRNLVSVLDRQV